MGAGGPPAWGFWGATAGVIVAPGHLQATPCPLGLSTNPRNAVAGLPWEPVPPPTLLLGAQTPWRLPGSSASLAPNVCMVPPESPAQRDLPGAPSPTPAGSSQVLGRRPPACSDIELKLENCLITRKTGWHSAAQPQPFTAHVGWASTSTGQLGASWLCVWEQEPPSELGKAQHPSCSSDLPGRSGSGPMGSWHLC